MTTLSRRDALKTAAALAALSSGQPVAAAESDEDGVPVMNRFATTVLGAEITGLYVTQAGDFFFNVQHPSGDNDPPFDTATIGAVTGFDINELPADFASLEADSSQREKERVRTALGDYQILGQGGDETVDGQDLGLQYTPDGEGVTRTAMPDFNGFVPIEDSNDEGYLFTNWEHRPGGMTRLHLQREGNQWAVDDKRNLDFRPIGGTYRNCFGTVSQWGTPLSGEENYAARNARVWNKPGTAYAERQALHLGYERDDDGRFSEEFPNPYRYGYIVEVQDPRSDDPTPVRHYTMGRASHENCVVMPDEKTVYVTSDGTDRNFFKFVADEAGELSAGTLYAAKAKQDSTSDTNQAGFDLEWIELGSASNDEIRSWLEEYDDVTQADYEEGETSYIPAEDIEAWANGNDPYDDERIAFLESSRAAGAMGATDEFRKMEGVNIRPGAEPGDYVYLAMSAVGKGMTDSVGDVQVTQNGYGAVYRLEIESDYSVSRMEPAVTGGPDANICAGCPYDAQPDSASKVCQDCSYNPQNEEAGPSGLAGRIDNLAMNNVDPENTIANPDNIVVLEDGRVIIGEDTGRHETNMIWIYDPSGPAPTAADEHAEPTATGGGSTSTAVATQAIETAANGPGLGAVPALSGLLGGILLLLGRRGKD